jgi:Fe-S-cluster-containing dehydrogenase component
MKYGLYIDFEWCSGCHACEMACKQENNLDTDEWGIRVVERMYPTKERTVIEYVPIPTEHCNFCMQRVRRGERPACVHHCMTKCMDFGPLEEMAAKAGRKRKSVVWSGTR